MGCADGGASCSKLTRTSRPSPSVSQKEYGGSTETHRFDAASAIVVDLGEAGWIRLGHFEDLGVKMVEVHGDSTLFHDVRERSPARNLTDLRDQYEAASGDSRNALLAQLLATLSIQTDDVLHHARQLSRSEDAEDRLYFARLAGRFPWLTFRGMLAELAFQDTDARVRSLAYHILDSKEGPWFVGSHGTDERRFGMSPDWPALWIVTVDDALADFDELAGEFGWVELDERPFASKTRAAIVWETPGGSQVWLVKDGYVNPHQPAFFARVFGTFEDYARVASNVPVAPADGMRDDFEEAPDEFLFGVLVTSHDPVESVCEHLLDLSRSASVHDRIRFATAIRYAPWLPLRSRLEEMAQAEVNEELRVVVADRLRELDQKSGWRPGELRLSGRLGRSKLGTRTRNDVRPVGPSSPRGPAHSHAIRMSAGFVGGAPRQED
jgi:hypothetical protein